ncbi:hypothetical protein MN202_10530 [Rheinheimera muenzenbergensis]|uniref:HEAT repeat-containing protein n=1 Tax=Rheinheimera muenzenbergensis TaxID=1193628 RepID=A0ABU8C754_9GAMM
MSRYDAMLAQVELLLNQRAQLPDNRYCTLKQLREHDQQLLTAINWLQQQCTIAAVQPLWLQWLLADNNTDLLAVNALSHLCLPEQSWLLLHQIKPQLFNTILPHWQKLLQQQTQNADNALLWTLAAYLQLSVDPFADNAPLTPAALWYLVLAKPAAAHQKLQHYQPSDDSQSIVKQLVLQLSIPDYLADIAPYSPEQLIESVKPHPFGLMLLLAAVDDASQAKLINYLAQTDQIAALAAMAYSGQLKFAPLLAELAQQPELHQAAADALALLLGTADSDACLAEPVALQNFHINRSGARQLCGAVISDLQLATVWRSGNLQQRQLASCLRKINATQQPLLAADALQVKL